MKQSLFILRTVRNVSRMCGQNALWLIAEGDESLGSIGTPLCVKSATVLHSFGNETVRKIQRVSKKMDSISYVYISWTIHGMWMIYITFETGGPKYSNTTAREETKTKRTLHSSRRLSFNELTNAKNLVLHSSHFALSWRCCTAVR